MKKLCLFVTAIFLLSFLPAKAQTEKGKILVSVTSTAGISNIGTDLFSLGLASEKIKYPDGDINSTYKTFRFNMLPTIGYFIMDNLVVGGNVLVSYSRQKSTESDYKDTETSLGIGPFVRYYYPLKKIYPFAEGFVGIGNWKEKWSNGSTGEDKEGLFLWGLGIGAGLPLSESVMIDAAVGYSAQSWKQENNDKYIYGTIGLKLGFTMLFGRAK
ncbi:MAG: outer membrane beta-barrel protein [Bacteroidota bacterium]|nr:outer membrane beta-barrel protein [Bacteroidota bacterium]